jgi:hypothetical protein
METNYNVKIEFYKNEGELTNEELNNVSKRIAEALSHKVIEQNGLVTENYEEGMTLGITVTRGTKSYQTGLVMSDITETNHKEVFYPELLTYEEKCLVDNFRSGFRGVFWHIDDFESKAQGIEENNGGKKMYDREQFEYALDQMIYKHDCEYGITWYSVDYYLNEYCCLSDEDSEILNQDSI